MANISEIFIALADPTRRTLFERIAKRERSVGELAEGIGVTRPAVSQHLQVLKQAGLVTVEKLGTRHIYAIDQKAVNVLRSYLDRMWGDALTNFKREVEKKEPV